MSSSMGTSNLELGAYAVICLTALFFAGWSLIDSDWKMALAAGGAAVASGLAGYAHFRRQSRAQANGASNN